MESVQGIFSLGLSTGAIVLLIALALLFSSYVKIVTVLSIVRAGLGTDGLPSFLVTSGLALALAFFVMSPTLMSSTSAIDKALAKDSSTSKAKASAIGEGVKEWKKFVIKNTDIEEKNKFSEIALKLKDKNSVETEKVEEGSDNSKADDLQNSWQVLAPAFLVTELKKAFKTGLTLFLPFLVIELIIANVLVAVGLTRLAPEYVALPFKILLFVVLDGWALITTNLVSTYI